MNRWIVSVAIVIAFLSGLGLGLSITSYTSLQGILAIVISAIGVIMGVFSVLKTWSKEIRLEFGKVSKDNSGGYFVRVQQKGGKVRGMAMNAEAHLTLEDTEYDYSPTVWADGHKRKVNIGGHQDLLLFRLDRSDTIIFPGAVGDSGYIPNPYPLNENIDKFLIAELAFEHGSSPKNYRRTIKQIMDLGDEKEPS
jgi:hypothetical protein